MLGIASLRSIYFVYGFCDALACGVSVEVCPLPLKRVDSALSKAIGAD